MAELDNIQAQYEKRIQAFDNAYLASELRNNPDALFDNCTAIN